MTKHPARQGTDAVPQAAPTKGDVVESVRAEDVKAGDILILSDGTHAQVDDIRHGLFWFPEGRSHGVSIGWESVGGSASGLTFRKAHDVLVRRLGGVKPSY